MVPMRRPAGEHAEVAARGGLQPDLGGVGQQRADVVHGRLGREHVGVPGDRQHRQAHVREVDLVAVAQLDLPVRRASFTRKKAW